MSILVDHQLRERLTDGLLRGPSIASLLAQINPASIDIRVGLQAKLEVPGGWREIELPTGGLICQPGEFLLVETLESFHLPADLAIELRLKSSVARRGWNHSLAFWIDPGWQGVLTMELQVATKWTPLVLTPGERIAQVIVHQLSAAAEHPYAGRYQGARGVEAEKIVPAERS